MSGGRSADNWSLEGDCLSSSSRLAITCSHGYRITKSFQTSMCNCFFKSLLPCVCYNVSLAMQITWAAHIHGVEKQTPRFYGRERMRVHFLPSTVEEEVLMVKGK